MGRGLVPRFVRTRLIVSSECSWFRNAVDSGAVMEFYFDESGDFSVPRTGHKVSVVMGVAISEVIKEPLFSRFEEFVAGLSSSECRRGEPKGALLTDIHREQFCQLLCDTGGLLVTPVTLDLSSLSADFERGWSQDISKVIAKNAETMLYPTARDELRLISRQFQNLSSSQALRIYSWANCFHEAIQHAFLFLAAGRHEQAWDRVTFEVDKVHERPGNREEKVFSLVLLAWLTGWSRRRPFALVEGIHTPTHPIVVQYDTPDGIDLGKLIRGNLRWESSSSSLGLQIADIACNIVYRAAQDLDDRRGAVTLFGQLMKASPYGSTRGPGVFTPRMDAPSALGRKYRALWEVMGGRANNAA